MKNKSLYFIGSIIIIIFFVYVFLFEKSVSEKVYDNSIFSGDKNSGDSKEYDIFVEEDMITFYDANGNSIIYVFENDRLTNVFNVYNAPNEIEAKRIANYFTTQFGSGEILDVNFLDTTVSVQMDMNYFSEYKDYSKKQLEQILLNDANLIKDEE